VHLSRVFRKCVGEGIGEYVHRLRVRAACEQILEPEISIAEVSLALGFADQSHFTRAFRRVTGMTPAAFRSSLMSPLPGRERSAAVPAAVVAASPPPPPSTTRPRERGKSLS